MTTIYDMDNLERQIDRLTKEKADLLQQIADLNEEILRLRRLLDEELQERMF